MFHSGSVEEDTQLEEQSRSSRIRRAIYRDNDYLEGFDAVGRCGGVTHEHCLDADSGTVS